MSTDDVLIVGAGVGGLTAGVALERAGHEVQLFERAEDLRTEGAGISVFQNALRCLDRIGVADAVVDAGETLHDGAIYDAAGNTLLDGISIDAGGATDLPLGVAVHRADLVEILEGALDRPVQYDAKVVRVDATGSSATVEVAGGDERTGALVVGADGLHSTVRRQVRPTSTDELRDAGYTAWRSVAEVPYDDPSELNPGEYWGAGTRFGVVPIGDDRVYWFAVVGNGVDEPGDASLEAFLERLFGDWPDPIPSILESTDAETIIETDIYDRAPIDEWGRGRATLLGDAAHPMTPDLGQGGCQAIEDAWVLADSLAPTDDRPTDALRTYERRRRDRTRSLVEASRRMGRLAQASHPWLVALRNLFFRLSPQWLLEKQYASILAPDFLES